MLTYATHRDGPLGRWAVTDCEHWPVCDCAGDGPTFHYARPEDAEEAAWLLNVAEGEPADRQVRVAVAPRGAR